MWPMPRAPISSTRNRVSSVAVSAVSGSPTSLLGEPGGEAVLGAGLAGRAGQGDEGGAQPSDHVPGEGAEGRLDVVDDDRRHADRAGGEHGRRTRVDDRRGEVVAVHAFPDEGDEEAAGAR